MSRAGELLTLVAQAANGAAVAWGTAPEKVWFVDYASEDLRAKGLTALVVMPNGKLEFKTRGNIAGDEVEVHVAVMAPRGDGSFATGDVVVDAAERVAKLFVGHAVSWPEGSTLRAVCTEAAIEPVISGDFMRQNNLWVSYVKLTLKVVF